MQSHAICRIGADIRHYRLNAVHYLLDDYATSSLSHLGESTYFRLGDA